MTLRSDQYVNSLHNFNEMSDTEVLRMKMSIRLKGVILTPNSHDYPTKKSMSLVRRMNVSLFGVKTSVYRRYRKVSLGGIGHFQNYRHTLFVRPNFE